MSKRKKKAIGDNPLDALVPAGNVPAAVKASTRGLSTTPPTPTRREKGPEKERLTVHVSVKLADRARNAVYWTPGLTLARLAEEALEDALNALEPKRGSVFPPRKEDLKGGRPPK